MQRYTNVAQDALGNVIQGMSVSVFLHGTQTLATIYSDNGITTIPNPVTTDALGTFFFYAASGRYDLQFAKTGLPTTNLPDVLLNDPVDPNIGDVAVVTTIAALKALAGSQLVGQVQVLGYYAAGDGGGGLFRWNSADVNADNGGTIIAPNAGGTGRWNRVIDQASGINVKWFGAKSDGTDATAFLAAVRGYVAGLAIPVKVFFPAGAYAYTASPNWAIAHAEYIALGRVELVNSGTGPSVILDGGSVGGGVVNVKWTGNFVIKGAATATDGFFCRALQHSKVEGTVIGAGAASAGCRTQWCVLTEFNIKTTVNEGAWVSQPANGYLIDQRGAGEYTASCLFMNPIVEGVSGTGIKIVNGSANVFLGGSSESNNRGVEIATGGNNLTNKFYGLDTESNAVEDYLLNCFDNTFYGCKASGLVHLSNSSVDNHFIGGYLNSVTIDGGAQNNSFSELTTGNAGGAVTDNGTRTAFLNVRDATAGVFRTKFATGYIATRTVVAYSASITMDASIGNEFDITATNGAAFTINAPTNPQDGQRITITIRNTSGGALGVITWNAVFKMLAFTSPTNGNSCSIDFRHDGTNWVQIAPQSLQIPN